MLTGLPGYGPFDVINVGFAVEKVPVELLKDQLKIGGRMVLPMVTTTALMRHDPPSPDRAQDLVVIDRLCKDCFDIKYVMKVVSDLVYLVLFYLRVSAMG